MEGATSASLPGAENASNGGRETAISGTGLHVWAVSSLPVARSTFSSALPWSEVMSNSASAAKAAVDYLERADDRIPLARMPDHVGVGVIHDDQRITARCDLIHRVIGDLRRAHLRLFVVRPHLARRRHQDAIFQRERFFAAARKEVGYVRVLLRLCQA